MTFRYSYTLAGAAIVTLAGFTAPANAQRPLHAGKQALEANPDLEAIPGRILVRYSHDATPNDRANARALAAANNHRALGLVRNLEVMDINMPVDRAVVALRAMPGVMYAEPDYVLRKTATTPNDEFFGLQWGMNNTGQDIRGSLGTPDSDIDMVEAWDIATDAPNFVVAIIDSGTQWDHPDLAANIWSNPGEIAGNGIDDDGNGYVDDVRGWDFYSNDNNPDDSDGHGTHTAGTVGADGNNSIGVAGVMWSCQIMPLRFLGPFGGSTADAIDALNYAVDHGVKVSNNSWGGGPYSQALKDAIDNAGASGHLFVAASGNDGLNIDNTAVYPGAYNSANMIVVANIDKNDDMAFDSNYGSTSVDIGAPGEDIASTYNADGYVWSSGTSMAAPHVTGVAALLWSVNPSWSWSQVKDRIMDTARPISSLSGKSVTGGMLNAYGALTGSTPPPPALPPDAPSGLSASDAGDGTATLSWNDNSSDEDGFEIQRERKQKGNPKWGSATTFSVGADATSTSDDPGEFHTFRYRVRSFNANGNSAWTGWVQVEISDPNGGDGGGNGNGGGNGGGRPSR